MPQTYYSSTPDAEKRFQCRHIFIDGRRCASPCLRREEFCYYHHTSRRPVEDPSARRRRCKTFSLPNIEDRSSIQLSIGQVLQRLAYNEIDPRRAGLLLYGLQIASLNLKKDPKEDVSSETVVDLTVDPALGVLAPRVEVHPQNSASRLLADLLQDLEADRRPLAQETSAAPEPEPLLPDLPPVLPSVLHQSRPLPPHAPGAAAGLSSFLQPAASLILRR